MASDEAHPQMNPLETAAYNLLAAKGIPTDTDRALTWYVSYELFEDFKPELPRGEHWRLFGYPVIMEFIGETTIMLAEHLGATNVALSPQEVS